jgi:hypothetical protein
MLPPVLKYNASAIPEPGGLGDKVFIRAYLTIIHGSAG